MHAPPEWGLSTRPQQRHGKRRGAKGKKGTFVHVRLLQKRKRRENGHEARAMYLELKKEESISGETTEKDGGRAVAKVQM